MGVLRSVCYIRKLQELGVKEEGEKGAFYQEECVGCLKQQLIQKVIFRGGEVCS